MGVSLDPYTRHVDCNDKKLRVVKVRGGTCPEQNSFARVRRQ